MQREQNFSLSPEPQRAQLPSTVDRGGAPPAGPAGAVVTAAASDGAGIASEGGRPGDWVMPRAAVRLIPRSERISGEMEREMGEAKFCFIFHNVLSHQKKK